MDDQSKELGPLLEHLAATAYPEGGAWQSWRFGRVAGGMNTIVYLLGNGKSDLAIKVTRRDARDRAGREYSTLRFLEQLGLSLAPRAVFLDRERFPQPVVVQQWVDGDVRLTPPEIDDDWQQLLAHLLAVHRITPELTPTPLPMAAIVGRSAADVQRRIQRDLAEFPVAG